ncbi:hypothetical protein Ciccas_014513 [Cichlidogyrus casuarinus]|uniref:Solute carrier family 13 member 4 n=1 Tax=Cichlidogyrus casuarinus TaxID=1844966 RepID=A0ABD2PJ43_9PLAT
MWPRKNPLTNIKAIWRKHHSVQEPGQEQNRSAIKDESLFLLPWEVVNKRFPWGILFTLGGSFALSAISQESGLSHWTGEKLTHMDHFPPQLMVFIISLITCIVTELASNVATATILLPIVMELACSLRKNPFLFAFPLTISSSFAFCLPVGTPPNAIVYSTGRVTVRQMVSFSLAASNRVRQFCTGILLNLIGVLICTVSTITYAYPLFNLDHTPDWANNTLMHLHTRP